LQQAAEAAVRRERERIARELHDGVGQELTAVALLLRGLSSWLKADRPDASAELDRVVQLVNGVIGGARSMAHELFESTIPDRDLVTALAELARSRNALAGPAVSFRSELVSLPALESRVGAELLRIAQEATANALRHGNASRVDIHLLEEHGAIRLVVEDDGRGLPPDAGTGGGLGLGIMRFRAHSLGAELELGPRDGGGTRVSCRVAVSGR
jgi:signal transduction histidine kinase